MPFLLFLSAFPCLSHTPTHIDTHTQHFSVMWLVECKISSLQLEENRFDKIPFSPRGALKARSGMVKHGTARLLSPHRPTHSASAWPRGAYLESAQWP